MYQSASLLLNTKFFREPLAVFIERLLYKTQKLICTSFERFYLQRRFAEMLKSLPQLMSGQFYTPRNLTGDG